VKPPCDEDAAVEKAWKEMVAHPAPMNLFDYEDDTVDSESVDHATSAELLGLPTDRDDRMPSPPTPKRATRFQTCVGSVNIRQYVT